MNDITIDDIFDYMRIAIGGLAILVFVSLLLMMVMVLYSFFVQIRGCESPIKDHKKIEAKVELVGDSNFRPRRPGAVSDVPASGGAAAQ